MKSNFEWKAWGTIDPLFAVAVVPGKGRNESQAWTESEFFAVGERDWRTFWPLWQSYGVRTGTCVEVGSGAGRMTRQLATTFDSVIGVDVSDGMIAYARSHVSEANVRFALIDGVRLPLESGSVDAAFSTHVFQHFESVARGDDYFAELYRVLSPGGSFMIHVPIIIWPYGKTRRLHGAIDALRLRAGNLRASWRRFAYRYGMRKNPPMRLLQYDFDRLQQHLSALGFRDVQLRIVYSSPEMGGGRHPFVMARKTR